MNDTLQEKWVRWSLERMQFLLSHVESFVEDEAAELRERVRNFTPQTGLEQVNSLVQCEPNDPHLPLLVLDRLTPFFEAGLLLQKGMNSESSNWYVTDLFWRGATFHLEIKDQVNASGLVPELTPLQVHKAPAKKVLDSLGLSFLATKSDSEGYLLRPTPTVALVLLSHLAAPWAEDHLAHAHNLVNKCFLY